MELTIRDWMVIIGVLLILAVLLDAWRRIRSDKYSRTKAEEVEPEQPPPVKRNDLAWFKELPNGGARVIERGDILRAARLDSVSGNTSQGTAVETDTESDAREDVSLMAGVSSVTAGDETEDLEWLDGMGSAEGEAPQPTPGKMSRDEDPAVFMLNVVARSAQGFRGEDILHILLACDLRLGDMSFFHRHEFEAGRGAIQFSVANMMQPGIFDIDNMADMTTPGLVFFLTLPGPENMMQAFNFMLETAEAVARNLDGDVLDESRSVVTRHSMDHSRQQIRDLERSLLAKAR
jgi:cell division protein ZipA